MEKENKVIKQEQYVRTNKESEVRRVLWFLRTYYSDHLWEKRVESYKNYFMYKIDRQLKIKYFQTNMKSPVTKMYVDAMWTWVYDNIINFRVIGRDRDDQKKAENVKAFLERGFSVSNSREEFMTSLKEAFDLDQEIKEIIKTLWLNQGNITSTSKELYIHRNTLQYRLDKFYERYGLSLKEMKNLTLCYLLID